MESFTSSQLHVLDQISTNRLTVVRAGPGSGKTRVFVEAFRRAVELCPSIRSGVAALSFTNTAHEEISRRIGGTVRPPHFVGTLDAFLLRFVVRPFGELAGLTSRGAWLLPSPLDELYRRNVVQYGPKKSTPIFRVRITRGDESQPELSVAGDIIAAAFASSVLRAKQAEWQKTGRVTHSDVHFLASSILNGTQGARVSHLISRRFPVILIDEFQDTCHFLARAVIALLRTSPIRGALVGDPDQAIFQFGGANRNLFRNAEGIKDAESITLDQSHRCPTRIAAVASRLSRSGRPVTAIENAPLGQAYLIIHEQKSPEMGPLLQAVAPLVESRKVTVLTRKVSTVAKLRGETALADCPDGCQFARAIHRATRELHEGKSSSAAGIVEQELGELLLDEPNCDGIILERHLISPSAWRKACHATLFEAMKVHADETWNGWVARLRGRVETVAKGLGVCTNSLGSRIRRLGNRR